MTTSRITQLSSEILWTLGQGLWGKLMLSIPMATLAASCCDCPAQHALSANLCPSVPHNTVASLAATLLYLQKRLKPPTWVASKFNWDSGTSYWLQQCLPTHIGEISDPHRTEGAVRLSAAELHNS